MHVQASCTSKPDSAERTLQGVFYESVPAGHCVSKLQQGSGVQLAPPSSVCLISTNTSNVATTRTRAHPRFRTDTLTSEGRKLDRDGWLPTAARPTAVGELAMMPFCY